MWTLASLNGRVPYLWGQGLAEYMLSTYLLNWLIIMTDEKINKPLNVNNDVCLIWNFFNGENESPIYEINALK